MKMQKQYIFDNLFDDIIDMFNIDNIISELDNNSVAVIKDERPRLVKHNKRNATEFKPLFIPKVQDVWFYEPATITWFEDGTKTVAVAGHGDKYDKEVGLAICMLKRVLGNKEYRKIMDKWCYKKENLS